MNHTTYVYYTPLSKERFFKSSPRLKELSHKIADAKSEPVESGVRLPKLETPKFDGNLLNWRVFWEQF